ncbi:MAG: helical backbone metal receptor [Bacteroidia bacterium]|nr:helical backbone metal receptor [Bacteroidia bacterium]MDW8158131.1 helical backbone metal receptor [Bacteroidia bacterium]
MNTRQIVDDLGRTVTLPAEPQRIISLCPSITETVLTLVSPARVVGVTKFCIHPKEIVQLLPKVGGTKTVDIEAIHVLKPDLIIAEKEENLKTTVEELEKHYPVIVFNVETYTQALNMVLQLGNILNNITLAQEIVASIEATFTSVVTSPSIKVLYFIWRKPFMVAGKNTYVNSILEKIGLQNCIISYSNERYPVIQDLAQITDLEPHFIFLSSEPYPFKEKHIAEFKPHFPHAKILLVEGEMFSWYGVRMQKAPEYFTYLLAQLES